MSSKKQEEEKKRGLDKRTPAQVAYEKMQEKRVGLPCPVWGFGEGLKTLMDPSDAAPGGLQGLGVTGLLCLPPANGEDPEESVENP